jgi:demethylmenaquinone methyltransferase / 2-methoxy-6-polyprenyl-1,4-benzoquinol methylase
MSQGKATRPLQGMFAAVPRRYDLINRLFTLRLDERWRALAAAECLGGAPARALDLCTGTGDLAIRLADAGAPGAVYGVDFSMPMLEVARVKALRQGAAVAFAAGDAAALPFRDGSFNVIGIAFGFRNLTYRNPGRDRYLAEILRVLEPGGRLVIVESSQPRSRIFRALAHLYIRSAVSVMGGIVSGQRGAYRYLAHSAIHFYNPEELSVLLTEAGFSRVEYRALLFGVAAIHVVYK